MDREKLKLIVRNLKLLIEALESEVLSDPDSYKSIDNKTSVEYHDDDGYVD